MTSHKLLPSATKPQPKAIHEVTRRNTKNFKSHKVLGCALLAGLWGCAGGGGRDAPTPRRPNVVLVVVDQFRADLCGAYGGGRNIATPNLDRLAREGAVLTHAVSSAPLCTPYRGMLMTGRYPTHTGLVLNWVEVDPRQRSIAHLFREAGYRTGLLGKWHLAAGMKKTSGYHLATPEDQKAVQERTAAYMKANPEPEYVPPGPRRLGFDHWEAYNFHSAFNAYYFYRDTPERIRPKGFETDILIDQAMDFMRREKEAGRPFFLVVAPHPPHPPHRPPACPPGYLEKVPEVLQWSPNVPEDLPLRKDPLAARCYYAMAKNTDDNMGRLIDFLDRSGLAENTILVFTTDHGTMLGSHGRDNKMVPYAEALHIPLLVRWPGHVPAGTRIDTLYTPMDHLPTLGALCGLTPRDKGDGRDLSAALLGRGRVERDAVLIMNYTSHWDYFDSGTIWPEWRGVKTERFTYVKWLTGKEELYDNEADPYQMANVVEDGKYAGTLRALRARLGELLAEAHDTFPPGTAYADWYDAERNLLRTALGPVGR